MWFPVSHVRTVLYGVRYKHRPVPVTLMAWVKVHFIYNWTKHLFKLIMFIKTQKHLPGTKSLPGIEAIHNCYHTLSLITLH